MTSISSIETRGCPDFATGTLRIRKCFATVLEMTLEFLVITTVTFASLVFFIFVIILVSNMFLRHIHLFQSHDSN